ncbi:MAG: DUF4288 domain-containing protein [Bdellovibrionota bacterium]
MAYIPKGAEWYIADLVVEIRVQGRKRRAVHINKLLVRAKSPEQAYKNALILGKAQNVSYLNTDNKRVSFTFRGLQQLNVVHDKLGHGAELSYTEKLSVSAKRVRAMLSKKNDLAVFAPAAALKSVNYLPKTVVEELKKMGFEI